jgi:mono/diheme cytochrome c family protein
MRTDRLCVCPDKEWSSMFRTLRLAFPMRLILGLGLGVMLVAPARGQQHTHGQPESSAQSVTSTRITMDALHAAGGVPPGWRFTIPAGDAAAGRVAFVDFKCYACHVIKGEQFPLKPGESATAGPELTGMGGHHPREYLAESIMNPSAVLVEGPGYIGGDGRSIMPTYPDMTLSQLANLVAYLKTLGASEATRAGEPAREQVVGGYRVRLVYRKAEGADHMHHHAHTGAMPMVNAESRLLVFLADQGTGEPIPYVPVTARIEVPGKKAQTVKLSPSLGREGFHYGASVTLPPGTNRIALSIGPTTLLRLGAGAPDGLKRAQTVTFDWR